jgi:uncharacterized protein YdhG (YjbR/CyaY superfamily)
MKATNECPETIGEYIAGFPPETQKTLEAIRTTIRQAAPEATEAISYQMPTFKLHGNLVHFAAFKKHYGFFPTSSGTEAFKDEIAGYKGGKGTIQFPFGQPIPYDLITRIVKFRVAENLERALQKQKKSPKG